MLVLSRQIGERIKIGDAITVTVLAVNGGKVRLGVEGPLCVPVLREELVEHPRARPAIADTPSPVPSELRFGAGPQ